MKQLTFETIGRIGIIKINRPKAMNALNREVVDELEELLDQVEGSSEVTVLIFGTEGHFAAGADIRSMVNLNEDEARAFSFAGTISRIAKLEIPTIAAIEGFALGGGLELALACDLRIASETAKLGLPEINLAIMPGAGGTIRTPRLIGPARAKELILLGDMIDADRAEHIGLVNKITKPETLMDTAMEWAEKLSKKAPVAMRTAKAVINEGLDLAEIGEAIKIEEKYWAALFNTQDQKEGMSAFVEKRKPNYQGK